MLAVVVVTKWTKSLNYMLSLVYSEYASLEFYVMPNVLQMRKNQIQCYYNVR